MIRATVNCLCLALRRGGARGPAAEVRAAAESGWKGRRIGWFVGAFLLAVALPTAWDSQSPLIGTAVVAVVSLVALGWTGHRTAAARARAEA